MKDNILDKIFKLSRSEKEIIYDNFENICNIIGIKKAQVTEEPVEEIQDSFDEGFDDLEDSEELNEDLKQKAIQYEGYLSKEKKYNSFLEKRKNQEEILYKIDENNEAEYDAQQDILVSIEESTVSYIEDFIRTTDKDFYDELIDSGLSEDFCIEIINITSQRISTGPPKPVENVPQMSLDDYLKIIATQIDQNSIEDFNQKKKDFESNPSLQRAYLISLNNIVFGINNANNEMEFEKNPQYTNAFKELKSLIDASTDKKEQIVNKISYILGMGEEPEEAPDKYIQEEIDLMAFQSTGEPFKNPRGEWVQVYNNVWSIPIKTKKNEQTGEEEPVLESILDEEGNEIFVPTPKINIEIIKNLHHFFVSHTAEQGIVENDKEMISNIKSIYEKHFSQTDFDTMQKRLLNTIWNNYREENPQDEFFSTNFRDLEKGSQKYLDFVLRITEEDIEQALRDDVESGKGLTNKFFEDMKFAKSVIRDISGYVARTTIASSSSISAQDYNFMIEFCEKYYGQNLESIEDDQYLPIGDLISKWNKGEVKSSLTEQLDYIKNNIIPTIIKDYADKGIDLDFDQAADTLNNLFNEEKIRYFKNVKDRAQNFASQQELSHSLTYSYQGASQFCNSCGRFRGRCLSYKGVGETGVTRIDGKCYYIQPERDENIILSEGDIQHMDADTVNKYFIYDEQNETYVQKKCDFSRNPDGEVKASCDLVDNLIFEDYARTPSINETFNRDIPMTLMGEPLYMELPPKKGEVRQMPILLNEAENKLVQNYSKFLLEDHLEEIENYFKGKSIDVVVPYEGFQMGEDGRIPTEKININVETIKEALKDYFESTASSMADSILSIDSRFPTTGEYRLEKVMKMQRSARILFSALEAYNNVKYGYESEKAQFMAGTDLLQLFACGSYWTNNSMLISLGIKGGAKKYNLPIEDDEFNIPMRDASGNVIKDGEKELTIREFLSRIKGIPFGDIDLPSDDSTAFNFIYMNRGTGKGYDEKTAGISKFVEETLKKANSFEIYKRLSDVLSSRNLPMEERENLIAETWESIKKELGIYKTVNTPAYAAKPKRYYKDSDGNLRKDKKYEIKLSNWVRQHFVEGHVDVSQDEMAFYSLDPEEAASQIVSMIDVMSHSFDLDMPYKNSDRVTDTDIQVFLEKSDELPKSFFGFNEEELEEVTSEERKFQYQNFREENPGWEPLPQKGDLIYGKKTNMYYVVLDANEETRKLNLLPGIGQKKEDGSIDINLNSLKNSIDYELDEKRFAAKKIHSDLFTVYAGKGAELLKKPNVALAARMRDKNQYLGSVEDSKKFTEAAIARWFEETNDSALRSKLEKDPFYKEILENKKDLNIFRKHYLYYKLREAIKNVQGVPENEILSVALNEVNNQLTNNYINLTGNKNLRNDEENVILLKKKIYEDIMQMSFAEGYSFEEIEEDLGVSISNNFYSIDEYEQLKEAVGFAKPEYTPITLPKVSTPQEDAMNFNKSSVATAVCSSSTGEGMSGKGEGKEDLLKYLTDFNLEGERLSEAEKTLATYKAFTTMTEKIMKLSMIDKKICSKIYDYIHDLSEKGCFIVSFTQKMNQVLGILGLGMDQSSALESEERPATISRAMLLYNNAQTGTIAGRVQNRGGFGLGHAGVEFDSIDGSFSSNISPIHLMLQSIPFGLHGIPFSESMNVIQGGKVKGTDTEMRKDVERAINYKKQNSDTWYRIAESKKSHTGNFSHVLITGSGDIVNSLKNTQINGTEQSMVLPYIQIVPYESFGNIERILEFKKRTGYKAIALTDAEHDFLIQVGLIQNA